MRAQRSQTRLLEMAACDLGPEDGPCLEGLVPSPRSTLTLLPASPLPHSLARGSQAQRLGSGSAGPAPNLLLPPRIHAEFQLSEPPDFPFWFSPGQFTGHIILSKDATHVRDFRLFVPNHRWEPWPGPSLSPRVRSRNPEGPSASAPPLFLSWERPGLPLGRDLELTLKEAA